MQISIFLKIKNDHVTIKLSNPNIVPKKLQKQARRTAMDRSNIGNLLNVAKHSRRLKLAISRSKNQNSH